MITNILVGGAIAWIVLAIPVALVLGRMIRDADDQPEFVCPDYYVPADWASERAA